MKNTLQESELSIYEYWHERDNEDSARLGIRKPYVFELGVFHTLPCKEITQGMVEAGGILGLSTNNRSTEIDQCADTLASAIDSQARARITHKLVLEIMSLSSEDYMNIMDIGAQHYLPGGRIQELISALLNNPQHSSIIKSEENFITEIRGPLTEDGSKNTKPSKDYPIGGLQVEFQRFMDRICTHFPAKQPDKIGT